MGESSGACGVNGNHKEFFAAQTANQCNLLNPGAIEGNFGGVFYSWTQLFGRKDDTVFYEVYRNPDGSGSVSQKQMTTIREITKADGTVETRRTRSAQGFLEDGLDDYTSYYRERRVSKEEFYNQLADKVSEYNIHSGDFKMHGPGKYYKMSFATFQLEPEWAATVAATTGSIDLFEAFLETANTDIE